MSGAVINTYLNQHHPKRQFNPASKKDLLAYKRYISTTSWGGPCPFKIEFPYLEIPYMIADKIARHAVSRIK